MQNILNLSKLPKEKPLSNVRLARSTKCPDKTK